MQRKTFTCILLVLCFTLLGSLALAETRLMVVTDLHYISPELYENSGTLQASATYGDGKMPHRSDAWLDALVQEVLVQAPDALVLLGDQSYNGEVLSHRDISSRLAEVQDAGIAVYAIPGNHDINNSNAFEYLPDKTQAIHSIPVSRYEKYYEMYGLAQAFSRDADSFSYAVALRDNLWFILMDAGVYEPFPETFGFLSEDTLHWLAQLLEAAGKADIQVITATHQSLLPHSDLLNAGYMIINYAETASLLNAHDVRLNMSGHLHIQHIAEKDGLYDIALSSLSNHPNQYAMVTIAEDGAIEYQTQALSPAHLPDGLPAESGDFFLSASYDKALSTLRNTEIPDMQKEQMATFAAFVNMHYYGGTVHAIRDEALADPALTMWMEHGSGTFWHAYLSDMLQNPPADMTSLSLPAIR